MREHRRDALIAALAALRDARAAAARSPNATSLRTVEAREEALNELLESGD